MIEESSVWKRTKSIETPNGGLRRIDDFGFVVLVPLPHNFEVFLFTFLDLFSRQV